MCSKYFESDIVLRAASTFAKLQDNRMDVDIIILPIFQMTDRSLVGLSNFLKDLQLAENTGSFHSDEGTAGIIPSRARRLLS